MVRKSKITPFPKIFKMLIGISIGILLLVSPLLLIFLPIAIDEARINTIIHIPPETEFLYQAEGRWGANVATRNVYYRSSLSISELEEWYQGFYPAFNPSQYGDWVFAVKALDEKALEVDETTGDVAGCSYEYAYACVSVALIDLRLQRPLDQNIVSYDGFSVQQDDPLYNLLDTLPETGTLIIYRYYVIDL
jgi:hypothetical protein